MQCVILAGGLGTRMLPETSSIPKALIPVAGKPFAFWQLSWLADQGVSDIIYSVGYLGNQIADYVEDGALWGVPVRYVEERDRLLGTAGALRLAYDRGVLDRAFLLVYGDSFLQVRISEVWAYFLGVPEPALMTVLQNDDAWDRSNAIFTRGLVTRYQKGLVHPPREMRWIDYGLSVWSRDLLSRIPPRVPVELSTLYGTLSKERSLAGYEAFARFYEVGSPQGRADLETFLLRRPRTEEQG
jgi:NDP-sugar pyrophosphorylase family protein